MPFKSKAQQKWAFASKQKWAKQWAKETLDMKGLPDKAKSKAKPRSKPGKARKVKANNKRR